MINPNYVKLRTIKILSYSDTAATNKIENSGLTNFSFDTTPGNLVCIIEGVDRTIADSDSDLFSSNFVAQ